METTTSQSRTQTRILLALVFFGGFANLATEIIGPRMFASMFGNATAIWAVIISVTLVGLSVGYAYGGRVPASRAPQILPFILIANALWLLAVSWFVWGIPGATRAIDFSLITTVATIAFFPPSVLFGMITPLSITITSQGRTHNETTTIVGNLYALGTFGSVLGALSAAFLWIPWVGLSLSLRIFALILVVFAGYFLRSSKRPWVTTAALFIGVLLFPQPNWVWADNDNLRLIDQREGYHQTVRVYTDDETLIQMHLGPTFQSRINLATGEPGFSYARTMIDLADEVFPDMTDKRALVLGGAGHTMAHALENRGAQVTEVEIDPVVVAMSDEYFGEIEGDIVIDDARVYVNDAPNDSFDLVLFDAFDSGTGIPPQLTTQEFYQQIDRILKEDGVVISNFVGTPEGRFASAYRAFGTTVNSIFPAAGAHYTNEPQIRDNIIIVAGTTSTEPLELTPLPTNGRILTDDHNPSEILFEQARQGFYFRR